MLWQRNIQYSGRHILFYRERQVNVCFVIGFFLIYASYVATASYGIKHSLLQNVECLIMHYVHGLTVKNGIKLGLK